MFFLYEKHHSTVKDACELAENFKNRLIISPKNSLANPSDTVKELLNTTIHNQRFKIWSMLISSSNWKRKSIVKRHFF